MDDLTDFDISEHPAVKEAEDNRRNTGDRARQARERKKELDRKATRLLDEAADAEADGDTEKSDRLIAEAREAREQMQMMDGIANRVAEKQEGGDELGEALEEAAREVGPDLRETLAAEWAEYARLANELLEQADRVRRLKNLLDRNRGRLNSHGRDPKPMSPVVRHVSPVQCQQGMSVDLQLNEAGIEKVEQDLSTARRNGAPPIEDVEPAHA